MIYVKWFLLALSGILLKYLVAFPLTPIIVLFAKSDGYLPKWLNWFQTFDAPLDGDLSWLNNRPYKSESGRYQRYINRCYWLWRNSLYGFSRSVLGVKHIEGEDLLLTGDVQTSETSSHSGSVLRKLYQNGELVAFQYYRVSQWGSSSKCTRLNIGWKLWAGQGDVAMICHSYTPFKHFGN